MNDLDLTKIPAKFRNEILRLRANLEDRDKTIAELTTAFDEKAPVTWDDFSTKGVLPVRAAVRFQTSKGWIEASLRDGQVLIHSQQALHINPQASNSIKVQTYWD